MEIELRESAMLIRLVYHSKLTPPDKFVGKEGKLVEAIRVKAAKVNAQCEISGVLLYNEDSHELIQALEGQEGKVLALFDKIKADSRHTDVKVQVQETICDRSFAAWGMLKGSSALWKIVKQTLPASVEGTVATFDAVFAEPTRGKKKAKKAKKEKTDSKKKTNEKKGGKATSGWLSPLSCMRSAPMLTGDDVSVASSQVALPDAA